MTASARMTRPLPGWPFGAYPLRLSGDLSKPEGIALLSNHGEHRDEDTFKTSGEGARSVLTPTHSSAGEGRPIPQAGTAGPEPGGLG